jgi:hypothetical protein
MAPAKANCPAFSVFLTGSVDLTAKSAKIDGILITESASPCLQQPHLLRFVVHVQRLCHCPAILSGDQSKTGVEF